MIGWLLAGGHVKRAYVQKSAASPRSETPAGSRDRREGGGVVAGSDRPAYDVRFSPPVWEKGVSCSLSGCQGAQGEQGSRLGFPRTSVEAEVWAKWTTHLMFGWVQEWSPGHN